MERRDFINRIFRWGAVVLLAGITILLGRKTVIRRDCSGCPDYAGCPGTDSCSEKLASR